MPSHHILGIFRKRSPNEKLTAMSAHGTILYTGSRINFSSKKREKKKCSSVGKGADHSVGGRHLLTGLGSCKKSVIQVENTFTDVCNFVGLSVDEVKKLRLEGISPIPREMAFPLMKTYNWHDYYKFIKYV